MSLVAKVDATWYCEHAADIVRARPADIEYMLEALTKVPAAARALALRDIQNVGKAAGRAVTRWMKEHPDLLDSRA